MMAQLEFPSNLAGQGQNSCLRNNATSPEFGSQVPLFRRLRDADRRQAWTETSALPLPGSVAQALRNLSSQPQLPSIK